jgi:endonuclease/exonuclease/phosphatase family protein
MRVGPLAAVRQWSRSRPRQHVLGRPAHHPAVAPTLRVATWNVERLSAASWKRRPLIESVMHAIDADCWVLTESSADVSLEGYAAIHSGAHVSRRPARERWVSILSRWPVTDVSTASTPWSVTALVEWPSHPVALHGVVLPYAHEPRDDLSRGPLWEEFHRELVVQRDIWARLVTTHDRFVVAGDLNQSLDGSRWYGSRATRAELLSVLASAGLKVATSDDVVGGGHLASNHLVDHICLSEGLDRIGHIRCWEPVVDGVRLSDHPGVAVTIQAAARGRKT